MNKYVLLAGLICSSPTVWAQNTCPSISEGTYTCISNQQSKSVKIAKGTTDDGRPAIQMTIDSQPPQAMPCSTDNIKIELCTNAKRRESLAMAQSCMNRLGTRSLTLDMTTKSEGNRLDMVLMTTYRDLVPKNQVVEYANVSVSLLKDSDNQFRLAVSTDSMSQGAKSKESVQGICTKN